MIKQNEDQEEQEVDLDAYVDARNEGATPQEAFEQATNNEEEEN